MTTRALKTVQERNKEIQQNLETFTKVLKSTIPLFARNEQYTGVQLFDIRSNNKTYTFILKIPARQYTIALSEGSTDRDYCDYCDYCMGYEDFDECYCREINEERTVTHVTVPVPDQFWEVAVMLNPDTVGVQGFKFRIVDAEHAVQANIFPNVYQGIYGGVCFGENSDYVHLDLNPKLKRPFLPYTPKNLYATIVEFPSLYWNSLMNDELLCHDLCDYTAGTNDDDGKKPGVKYTKFLKKNELSNGSYIEACSCDLMEKIAKCGTIDYSYLPHLLVVDNKVYYPLEPKTKKELVDLI